MALLTAEPYRKLCNELYGLVHNSSEDAPKPLDRFSMDDYMVQYSKQKFAKKFHFDFDDENTKPPNLASDGLVRTYQQTFIFVDLPATKVNVEDQINYLLFSRTPRTGDYSPFPDWALADMYDNTRDHFLRYTSAEGIPYTNEWGTVGFQKVYNSTTSGEPSVQEISHFLYNRVELSFDLPKGGKEKVEKTFINYLGVFSTYESEW